MTTYYLKADLTFKCADPAEDTDHGFDRFTDAVHEALLDLEELDEGVVEPDMTIKITERWASIYFGIKSDTLPDAVRLFSANLRTALHAVGCKTAEWPSFFPTTQKPEVLEADAA